MRITKALLSLLGVFGFALFGALSLSTLLSPHTIERSANTFLKLKLEQELNQKIDTTKFDLFQGIGNAGSC